MGGDKAIRKAGFGREDGAGRRIGGYMDAITSDGNQHLIHTKSVI